MSFVKQNSDNPLNERPLAEKFTTIIQVGTQQSANADFPRRQPGMLRLTDAAYLRHTIVHFFLFFFPPLY